ncbi:MAG: DegV family protein [Ruminococcaceae bacterium]|nr:DegV family protein [Oscillospiraceae bacterium]
MAVRLIVDSASDILPEEAQALGIVHLPMTVYFGETEYADAVTLSHRGFYERLIESDVLPTTCQIPPSAFEAAFASVTQAGDTAVVVTISSKLSGTYQSACIAAEEFDGDVVVVDSESVSLGERILVQCAQTYVAQGLSAQEIKARLDEDKKHIRVMALVDTLEYLKKGGRISAATAFAGGLLSIKPVVGLENGELVAIGKARGSRQGNNLLRELVQKVGIDFEKPLCLAYSGLDDSLLKKYIEDSKELWQDYDGKLPIATVGCTIGAHVGPGAVAVAFFEQHS